MKRNNNKVKNELIFMIMKKMNIFFYGNEENLIDEMNCFSSPSSISLCRYKE